MTAHLLESTLFAAAAGLATLALRKNPARTRHWVWMAASVKFLIPFALFVALGNQAQWRSAPPAPPPQLTFVMEDSGAMPAMPAVHFAAPPTPAARHRTPAILFALWFCGFAAIAARWWMRWRRLAAVVRRAEPLALPCEGLAGLSKIRLVCSATALEPGVFGIFRPVLALPAGIAERLSGGQLQAVLAHELAHIRRRDNLAAAIHMLVEALFWFHPLVWWIGARLVEERERACDEEVLDRGGDPQSYAESILAICRLCLESPLPCVSGITGGGLRQRIEAIMTPRRARHLDRGRKLQLAGLATAAVTGPIAIGLLHAPAGRAQSPTAAPLGFEVASVKRLHAPARLTLSPTRSGGRITWTAERQFFVRYAYHLQPWRVSGLEPDDSMYQIDATTDPSATEDQVRLMFQTLLADRFKLAVHRETRELNGYGLVAGRNGPKIHPVSAGEQPAAMPEWFKGKPGLAVDLEGKAIVTVEYGQLALTGRRITMAQLAEALQQPLGAFVLDQTGLAGRYYVAMQFARQDDPGNTEVPSLAAAVQEQLGLKLEKQKGPVEMLVVDHMETEPSGNVPAPEPPAGAAAAPSPYVPEAQADTAAPPAFDVASVKQGQPGASRNWMLFFPGGRFIASNATMQQLVQAAWHLQDFQLTGGPAWLGSETYNIEAKPAGQATREQSRAMLRTLLVDRFKLAVHYESKEMAGYELVVAQRGAKVQALNREPADDDGNFRWGGGHVIGQSSMADFAELLTGIMGRPVADQTALKGIFDLKLALTPAGFKPRDPAEGPSTRPKAEERELPAPDPNGPDIFAAIQEQLGLKLEARKDAVRMVVIDRVERVPTGN